MAQVTATIKDPSGTLYTNARVEAIFVPAVGATALSLASGSVFSTFSVNTTDSFGVVSLSVTGNDLITPAGSQWRFSILSSTTPPVGFSTNITITGASQDISATLQAAAASLPAPFGSVTLSNLTTPQINHQRVIDGVTYPNTGAGFQQAVTDCIADALCSDVDARLLGSVTTTTTTSLTKPMRLVIGANTIISGTSDPVICFGNNAIQIEGVAGEGSLGTVSVIKSTAVGSRVLAPCATNPHILSITLRGLDLWNGAANSTAKVLDFTNVNQSRVDNCFIQTSAGATGDLVFVTVSAPAVDAFYNNFFGCKLFGSTTNIGYHFTNGANSNSIYGGKIDNTSDCLVVDSTGTQTNEISIFGTVCESQALSVIHTIGNTAGVRWFGGRWESPAPATLFNISASSTQIEVMGVGEYNTQTCGTTNSVVTIVGWPVGSPCISSGIDIFTPTNISSQAYIGQNSGVTSTFTNNANANDVVTFTTNATTNGNGVLFANSHAGGNNWRFGEFNANGEFNIRNVSQTGQPAWGLQVTGTTSARGILTHAITATRTYTFPDVTGSVQVNSQAPIAAGSLALFTGSTGACSTTGTQSGGSWVGRVTCTAATAASTLVINPGTTAPNGWVCTAFDETTRANLLQQTATSTTNCTLTATSITQNDVIVFQAIAF